MTRLLLATLILLPAVLMAQDTPDCDNQEGLQYDLDGDMLVGVGDLVQFLSWFNANFDLDQDGVLDCEDECVGEYDECGVCNGPGPQDLEIDTIITTYDSVYVDAIDDWLIYELGTDTLFSLVCEESNVFNSCGDDVEMDGYSYSTVLIGDQCWFAENLRTTVYGNGDVIPAGLMEGEWTTTPAGATAVYGEAAVLATITVLTSMLAMKRSLWRRMAVCTTGTRWTMLEACVLRVGTSLPMANGWCWKWSWA